MLEHHAHALHDVDEDAALRRILEGTATQTGEDFFAALVENLSRALHTRSAWVTEFRKKTREFYIFAFWRDGQLSRNFVLDVAGTPCELVIEKATLIHYPDNILDIFPDNSGIREMGAVSYMGMPLLDGDGTPIGNLAVLDDRPMPEEPRALAIFQIFTARASSELQRIRAENAIRKSEEKYRRIIETTSEGFFLTDADMVITDVNDAFTHLFGYERAEVVGRSPRDFATEAFQGFIQANESALFRGQLKDFSGEIVTAGGTVKPVHVYGDRLRDDGGNLLGFMYFIVDMTKARRSLTLAAEVQKILRPQNAPRIAGFDIAGHTLSCEELGGDYFDYLAMPDCPGDHVNLVVGDVTGHGVDAALVMTSARALLRMRAAQCGNVAEIVSEMNHHLSQDLAATGIFMTLFIMRLDPGADAIRWIRAGHLPAIVYDPAQDVFTELKGEGMALGVDENFPFIESIQNGLKPGQIIAVGTDGITEARNRRGELYGRERFQQAIRSHAALKAAELNGAVFADWQRHMDGGPQEDDATLLIVKVQDSGGRRPTNWEI